MKKTIFGLFIIMGLASCEKKILEKVDFNGVDEVTVYSNESTATQYLNFIYNLVMPMWPSNQSAATLPGPLHNISDDANGGSTPAVINGTLTAESVTDFYGSGGTNNAYGYIRKLNILITSVNQSPLTPEVKARINGQAYFLRAWVYFQLWKLYGGIPYLTHPQDWISEDLQVPRNKSSECVDSMLTDLSKCSSLPSVWSNAADKGRITKDAALALKGRILLYWASPQFNQNDAGGVIDATRWEKAYQANRAAYDTLTRDGYALYSSFSRIFFDAPIASDMEPILFRSYNGSTATGLYNSNENARPYSESSGSGGQTNNPTWNLVQAFPMKNGLPITATGSGYDPVFFWKNRDPRFSATIVYNGALWQLSGKSGRKQYTYTGITEDKTRPTVTGFYTRKNIDSSLLAANSTYGKTFWVELRMAEVMMNLAESANWTNRQSDAYDMLKAVRKRAGIDAGTGSLYGLAASMTKDSMQTVIMNERRVEFAFENKRYDDLRRTRTFDKLNGTKRMALIIAPKPPYTAATLEAKDANGVLMRDKLNLDGADYTTYFTATAAPITNELNINYLPLYYFYAIPSSNISKNPKMIQTKGWIFGTTTGTFDPTQ